MEGYGYPYHAQLPSIRPTDGEFPDHGDGYAEYYNMGPLNKERELGIRRSRSRQHIRNRRSASHSESPPKSRSRSKSRSPRSVSRTRTLSKSRSASQSRSQRRTDFKEPGFLDAFRVLYLTPSKHKKNTSKYLATEKRQDRIQELLKSDGLGSKRWLLYPRSQSHVDTADAEPRAKCDRRIKVDGDFFRKYKRSRKVDSDAPIAKLKRWELLLYKKLGFIQAVS